MGAAFSEGWALAVRRASSAPQMVSADVELKEWNAHRSEKTAIAQRAGPAGPRAPRDDAQARHSSSERRPSFSRPIPHATEPARPIDRGSPLARSNDDRSPATDVNRIQVPFARPALLLALAGAIHQARVPGEVALSSIFLEWLLRPDVCVFCLADRHGWSPIQFAKDCRSHSSIRSSPALYASSWVTPARFKTLKEWSPPSTT